MEDLPGYLRSGKGSWQWALQMEALFDCLPDTYFYVKDRAFQLVRCNDALVKLLGLKCKMDLIGRRETDFFPLHVAKKVQADDGLILFVTPRRRARALRS